MGTVRKHSLTLRPVFPDHGTRYCTLASIEKYLSGVTNSAQEDTRFKGLEIWKDKNWYTKLRAAINKAIVLKCIEAGRPLSEKRRSVW